jgi:hypothetical protein
VAGGGRPRDGNATHREGTPHTGTPGEPRDDEPAMASTRRGAGYGVRRGDRVTGSEAEAVVDRCGGSWHGMRKLT